MQIIRILILTLVVIFSGLSGVSAQNFSHPGILNTRVELDFIKQKVNSQQEPWKSAFNKLKKDSSSSLSFQSKAVPFVRCGSGNQNPSVGCGDELRASSGVYSHALQWYITGNPAHAKKAIEILNDWSYTLKGHTDHNAPLMVGWTAGPFVRGAEIIRHTYDGWSAADQKQFEKMCTDILLPEIINGKPKYAGNWELSMIESILSIAVFTENSDAFNKGISLLRKRIPATIYLKTDGLLPLRAHSDSYSGDGLKKYWSNPTIYFDGLMQETCRDSTHFQYALAAMGHAAEIAHKQGVDIYGEFSERFLKTMELHANWLNGGNVPSNLCRDGFNNKGYRPAWEILYNHFHNRRGKSLPKSESLIAKNSPDGINLHMQWATLSHANLPIGLAAPRNLSVLVVKP
jgi:hypothetical protein